MTFVHRPYVPGETIAAIATAAGEGAIAIVRLSGKEAVQIVSRIFSGPVEKFLSHTVHFGQLRTVSGEKVDEVLIVVMRAPRSFTGEDTVEIQCHGGRLITKRVLETVLEAGARAALPGEFSFRAYLNGKIDLAQAEAIQGLIHAKNERALHFAGEQLEGLLSKKIKNLQKELTDIAAILEAWVDFPEEGLEFADFDELITLLEEIMASLQQLHRSFEQGKIIHDGLQLSLLGSPNVGKSSLMNALLGKERAIVSPIAGTTRDLIEEDLYLNGLHMRLIDTAGIRETEESIEEEGIRRSRTTIDRADLILLVLDSTQPLVENQFFLTLPPEKTIAVWNKIDLPSVGPLPLLPFRYSVEVSAQEMIGLDSLHHAIDQLIWQNRGQPSKDEVVLTQLRHKESIGKAIGYVQKVIHGLQNGISAEFVAFDIRQARIELGTIIGTDITEDMISAIFSKFCIGK